MSNLEQRHGKVRFIGKSLPWYSIIHQLFQIIRHEAIFYIQNSRQFFVEFFVHDERIFSKKLFQLFIDLTFDDVIFPPRIQLVLIEGSLHLTSLKWKVKKHYYPSHRKVSLPKDYLVVLLKSSQLHLAFTVAFKDFSMRLTMALFRCQSIYKEKLT